MKTCFGFRLKTKKAQFQVSVRLIKNQTELNHSEIMSEYVKRRWVPTTET